MQINRLIRFDPNFFPTSQRGRLSISGGDEDTANSVARGSGCGHKWPWAILKIQSREKLQSRGFVVFWATFIIYPPAAQSVYRQIKIKIDPFTNVYHTWNVYLVTSERRGGCNHKTTWVSARAYKALHSRNKHDNSHYRLYKIINTRLR